MELRAVDGGQGVFADRPYAAGDVVLVFTGTELSTAEAERRAIRDHCLDIGRGRQLHVDAPARFVNHGCDPNTGLRDAVTLVALVPIAAGEEIRFDYSTCMPDAGWSLDCRCGSPRCRGRVTGFPSLDEATRRRLLALGVVPGWLQP